MKLFPTFFFIIFLFSCSDDNGGNTDDQIPCDAPTGISIGEVTEATVTLNWDAIQTNTFEIEIGLTGFTQGQGQIMTSLNNSRTIIGLEPETSYQFYLRTNCDDNNFSIWEGPFSFTTIATPPTCNLPTPILMTSLSSASKLLRWEGSQEIDSYTIEYGVAGFTLGNGETINTIETSSVIDFVPAVGSYQLYIRSNCQGNISSDWVGPLGFFTNGSDCGATNFSAVPLNGAIYNTFLSWGETWITGNNATSWLIEYGLSGFELGTGTIISTDDSSLFYVIEDQMPSTQYDYYIKGICGNGGTSLYTGFITYTTPD